MWGTKRRISSPPIWINVQEVPASSFDDDLLLPLDAGERAAIELAVALRAELLLMDDRDGVRVARRIGLAVTGTIGILDMAAHRGLLDLADGFARLRRTSFRCPDEIMANLLTGNREATK
jgi:predicted nucleic acid-binding protein